jgi:hypothetical protein
MNRGFPLEFDADELRVREGEQKGKGIIVFISWSTTRKNSSDRVDEYI